MSWKEDVQGLLERLPRVFRLQDVYRFVPLLSAKYPDNHHVEEKIRQVLQQLRDEGILRFVAEGHYEKVQAGNDAALTLPLTPGQEITRLELATLLGQAGDAALRRGMFKPAAGKFVNHMLLFHNEAENPYGDKQQGQTISYIGEGREGNQELKRNNATLANHLENGVQVHYFVQPPGRPNVLRYAGPVYVETYAEVYRPGEQRLVWEFTLQPADNQVKDPIQFYADARREMVDYALPPGPVSRPVKESIVARRLRSKDFRRTVISAYRARCTICGDPFRRGSLDELQAAHIMSVAADGPDELRNGLSLCVRHHWAFDNGFFTIGDDHRAVWLAPTPDPHAEVSSGLSLDLPMDVEHRPHRVYLAWHRSRWAAGATILF